AARRRPRAPTSRCWWASTSRRRWPTSTARVSASARTSGRPRSRPGRRRSVDERSEAGPVHGRGVRRRTKRFRAMSDLKQALGERVGAAFAQEGLPAELGRVTASDRPDLADFQANGALAAAKRVGKNPRELAGAVAARLAADPRLASVEVAGPGFINLKVAEG